jgi:hypothetical protein
VYVGELQHWEQLLFFRVVEAAGTPINAGRCSAFIGKQPKASSESTGLPRSALKSLQPRRDIICREIMSAVDAVLVRGRHAPVALPAACSHLAGTLRAEVKVGLSPRAARRATGDDGLPQQEVEHGTNSSRHDEADRDPEAEAHRTPGRILAHIADHEYIERRQSTPGEREIDPEADRGARVMNRRGQYYPEKVLHYHECQHRHRNRPARNETHLVGERGAGIRISKCGSVFHRWAGCWTELNHKNVLSQRIRRVNGAKSSVFRNENEEAGGSSSWR